MAGFNIPPVSVLVGSTLPNLFRVMRTGRVEPKYYHKVFLTSLICLIASPFHLWEKLREHPKKVKVKAPIFILGHWRSGTTLVHNLLCQDPNAAYITTYHSLFPRNLYSKWIFKNFVLWKIPDKRPSDDMALGANLPQEDDFAMANLIPAFYSFFFFPDFYKKYYNRHVRFEDKEKYKEEWINNYDHLIRKGIINTKGKHAILKNPANTARIGTLLEKYPDAKFIHIYRNPVTVYLSIKKFFLSLFPTIQLQNTSEEQIIDIIFDYYKLLMSDYLEQKAMIPADNFYEIRFEDFEKDPLNYIENIYQQFDLKDWDAARESIESYMGTIKTYKKNSYSISKEELDRIQNEWDFAFKAFDYSIPSELEIS